MKELTQTVCFSIRVESRVTHKDYSINVFFLPSAVPSCGNDDGPGN